MGATFVKTRFARLHVVLVNNGGILTLEGSTFDFYQLQNWMSDPACGPPSGGTEVLLSNNLTGIPRTALSLLACRFGAVRVAATLRNEMHVACFSPPLTALQVESATVPVEISLNSVDFNSVAGQFFRYANFVVSTISPASGPMAGGTLLTISHGAFSCEVAKWMCLVYNWSSDAHPMLQLPATAMKNFPSVLCYSPQVKIASNVRIVPRPSSYVGLHAHAVVGSAAFR